jgi:endonuclease/exonuclease/phosphatase (EEP) superfamily protein YafD
VTQLGSRVAERWSARPRRSRRWHVLTTFGVLGALAALIGLIAYYHAPASVYALGLAAVSPYLVFGAVVAAVLFGISRGVTGWVGLGVCVALSAWFVVMQAPLFVATTAPPGRDVVVLTANLRLGGTDPRALVAAVRTGHVDVLMLEELTPEESHALERAGLAELLPHAAQVTGYNAYGTGLFSRYPLEDTHSRRDFGFGFVTARVAIPGVAAAPTAVALHMYGPVPGSQTARWVHDLDHLPSVLRGLPADAPVLVGGDFNATRDVAQFRRLLQGGYADAADQAGAGFTPTYPANRFFPPLLAIDHVLTRGAVARSVDTIDLPGSDHRGLLVTVRLPS